MNARIKQALRYAVSLALMGLFLYWAFHDIKAAELWVAMYDASLIWLGIIIATTLATVALRAWRWTILMRPFAAVSVWDASLALAVCYAANAFLPRSGEVLRVLSLKWRHSVSIGSNLATVAVERIMDMVWLLLFLGISFMLLRTRIEALFPTMAPWMGVAGVAAALFFIALLALLALVSIYRDRALNAVGRILQPLSGRLSGFVVRMLTPFVHGLEALHTPSAYVEILLSSVLLNAGYILIIYQAFIAFDLHVAYDLGPVQALVINAISALGFVAPVPGGTGSYHFLFKQSLFQLFAVPEVAALACATVLHALANLLYIALGGPAFLLLRRHRSQLIENEE